MVIPLPPISGLRTTHQIFDDIRSVSYNDLIGWGSRICNCRLLHCPPLFNRIQAVCLPLCLRVLPGNPPLLQSHWRIVYLSRTSFYCCHSYVQSACYYCHSYYSASFFFFLSFFHSARLPAPSTISLVHCLPLTNLIRSVDHATVVTHTTQPLFFLFLSFFHSARLPAPSTISLVHCLPLTNLIRSVGLLLLSLILLSLFFSLSLFLSLSPLARPFYNLIGALSTSHEPHSFSRPATHSYYSASFFLFLYFFLSVRCPAFQTFLALYASFYTQWVWSEADSYPSTAMPYLNKT